MLLQAENVVEVELDDEGRPLMGDAITGDSSSGAIPVHVPEGEVTEFFYVSPYHYYRIGMDGVDLFPSAGDDHAIVPEGAFDGECEIVSEPEMISDSAFRISVKPTGVGNWIASLRTYGKAYESKYRKYARRPRLVQFRICTKPPIEEYVEGL